MAIVLSQPVDGPHIGEPGHSREPPEDHRLPNGRPCFRVTQTFDSTTGYYQGVPHNAVDIGNYNCGDRALAMLDGSYRAFRDSAGAIGVRGQHASGWICEIWHLDAAHVPFDRWVTRRSGDQIGVIGRTGLGNVCHGHLELKKDGKRYNVWLFLAQNVEGGMSDIPPNFRYYLQGVVGKNNRIRADPQTEVGSRITDKAYFVQVYGQRDDGEPWNLGGVQGTSYTEIGLFGKRNLWVATPLITNLALTSAGEALFRLPDSDEVEGLRQKVSLAATAIDGAINAIEASLAALRSAVERLRG